MRGYGGEKGGGRFLWYFKSTTGPLSRVDLPYLVENGKFLNAFLVRGATRADAINVLFLYRTNKRHRDVCDSRLHPDSDHGPTAVARLWRDIRLLGGPVLINS